VGYYFSYEIGGNYMACGSYPGYGSCPFLCDLNTGGDQFRSLEGLLNYCDWGSVGNEAVASKGCVKAYLYNCRIVDSSSGSQSQYSSTSVEFNPDNVIRGFADYNEIFALIFACFVLVKLVWMAK